MNDTSDKDKLLGQLRIDRSEEAPQAGKGWIAAGVAVLVIMAGAAWWWSRASATFEVQIATAAAPAAVRCVP